MTDRLEYIGTPIPPAGALSTWSAGLALLLKRYPGTATALVCLGASVGAPISRLIAKRNPVIGLVDDSSRGKGTVINYALSVWLPPELLTVPAGSSAKGLQDRAGAFPDCPFFADELQLLLDRDPNAVQEVLYFAGNGQRRVTSSRTGEARGGERRYGVAFFAAERPVTPGLNLGVQYRTWELDGAPLPYPDADLSEALQRATRSAGAVAKALGPIIRAAGRDALTVAALARVEALAKAHSGLAGDDAAGLAIVEWGLEQLAAVTGQAIPVAELLATVAARIVRMRASVVDRETMAWQALLDLVLNAVGEGQELLISGQPVAWRNIDGQGNLLALDINTTAPPVALMLSRYGSETSLLRTWGARGLIERGFDQWKVRHRGAGRVMRLSGKALKQLGDERAS